MFFSLNKKGIISFQTLSILFAAILLISVIFFSLKINSPYILIFANIIFLILNFLVIIILVYVTQNSSKFGENVHRGWFLITLSQVATFLGNVTWSIVNFVFNQYPNPSVACILFGLLSPVDNGNPLFTCDSKKPK